MKIFTIGFTNKRAERFFESLRQAGVSRVVDVRLNNVSQLSGFAKKNDLQYFLRSLAGIEYTHVLDLAPTKVLLDSFKKRGGDWSTYEAEFLKLMQHRHIEKTVAREVIDRSCLLCSEDEPHNCHRRLVAEYLRQHWPNVTIEHITSSS